MTNVVCLSAKQKVWNPAVVSEPECAPNRSYPLFGFGGIGDGDESESELSNRLYSLSTALCFSSLAASVFGFGPAVGAGAVDGTAIVDCAGPATGAGAAAGTTIGAGIGPAIGAGVVAAIGAGVMGGGAGSV